MKRLLFFLLVLESSLCFSQTKISEMVNYTGNPKDAYVPIVIGTANRRVKASLFAQDKIENISIGVGTTYDTLKIYKFGVLTQTLLTRGSASTWGTLGGSLSAQSDLVAALGGKQALLIAGQTIKTINGQNPLGPGDINISGSGPVDGSPMAGSTNPVSSNGVYTELQKPLNHKYLGGGIQLDSGSSGPNLDTFLHRTLVNSSSIVWNFNSDRTGVKGDVVGGTTGGASTNASNSFTAASTQSMQRTTDGDILTLAGPSAGGYNYRIGTDATYPFIMNLVSNTRVDHVAPAHFFRGGYVNFLSSINLANNATAASTATQSSSFDLTFITSLWNGTAANLNYAGFKYVANTGVNGNANFGIYVNGSGGNPDLFNAQRAIGIDNLTRKVTIDNLNDGAADAIGIIGGNGEIKKGARNYSSDYATAGNGGAYVIPDNVRYVGIYSIDGNTASTSLTLPNPASYPQRALTIRNGSGVTVSLNSYSIVWKNGQSNINSVADDREIEIKSDGTRWIRVGSNYTGF